MIDLSIKSLRARLILIVTAVTVVPIVGAILYLAHLSTIDSQQTAEHDLASAAQNLAFSVEKWDESMVFALENLKNQPDIISMDPARQKPILMEMAKVYSRFSYIHIDIPSGLSIVRADDKSPIDYHDREWFKQAIGGKGVSRETLISRSVGRPAVTIATAIFDGPKVVGVAAVGVELTSVLEETRAVRLGRSGYAIVVDEKGRTLAHPDNSYSSTLKDISSFAPVRFVLQGNHGAIRFEDERGVAWHAYGWPVGNGWSAVTLEPENEVLAQASLIQRIASGVALCAIALVAALISLASRTVLRPIHNLTEAARGLANGDWKSRAPENRADELGILARTFNSMAGQLEQGYRHVEQEVARRTAELTRNNVELREARHAAEAANRAKDQFLANMSHEIRTPMTAILGYTEVLETNPPAAEREDAMQIIHRNGEQLLAIINNILDLSKIHADGLSISKVDFDLSAWTNELVAQMQPRAEKKGLKLETIFDESIPARIHSDPLRLRQILTNLADNAIKFTDAAGLVTIRVSCNAVTRNGAEASDVRFEVSDSGLGMSGEQVARLFKPFTQVDNSMTRRHGGTGLGLSISKRLAEMLGGELSVDSQLGRGSTFRLIVDGGAIQQLQKSPANSSAQPIQPIHLKGKILLAEDGADNQRLISQFLRNAGAEVIIAENGKIALGLAQSQHFDLILMDMQMPEIDGYDATRQLRRSGCNLPIVALTAHAMADDRSKCLAAGCDDYLSKPINKTTLLTSVARHIDSDAPALRIKRAS